MRFLPSLALCLAIAGSVAPSLPAMAPALGLIQDLKDAEGSADAQDAAPRLEYQLLVMPAPLQRVHGRASLSGLDPNKPSLVLYMVRRYGFVTLDEPRLEGPPTAVSRDGQALVVERLEPYRWIVHKGDVTELELAWVVPVDHRQQKEVAGRDEYQFPYLDEEHGMLTTSALLVVPEGLPFDAPLLTIETPEGWPVVGPWPQVAPGVYRPVDEYALVSNLFAVGRWESTVVEAAGAEVQVLFAPGQDKLQELVAPLIAPVLTAELELFGMRPFERYTVLFGRPDAPGLGGSPKQGSMTMYVDPRMWNEAGLEPALQLVAHEFFHTWGHARYECPGSLRFFNEGFTDYYAQLIPARLGITSMDHFADQVESAMADWESNPLAGSMSLIEAGGDPFFENPDAYQLIYRGGLVLAALADVYLRQSSLRIDGRSGDLDELMRSFNNDPRWSPGGRAPALRNLRLALADRLGHARARTLMSLARSPKGPDLVQAFAAAGVELGRESVSANLSLRANLDGTRITNIDPRGMGGRLGLRKGDVVRKLNGAMVSVESELRSAWSEISDRVWLEVDRDGESLSWEQDIPMEIQYELPLESWLPEQRR